MKVGSFAIYGILLVVMIVMLPFEWRLVKNTATRWQAERLRHQQTAELTRVNTRLSAALDQSITSQPYIQSTVPENIDLVKQTDHLDDLASVRGVTVILQNISQEEPGANPIPFRTLRILLTASGPPHQLISYLDALEHDPHLNRVVEWELHTAGTPELPAWQLDTEVEYFFSL